MANHAFRHPAAISDTGPAETKHGFHGEVTGPPGGEPGGHHPRCLLAPMPAIRALASCNQSNQGPGPQTGHWQQTVRAPASLADARTVMGGWYFALKAPDFARARSTVQSAVGGLGLVSFANRFSWPAGGDEEAEEPNVAIGWPSRRRTGSSFP